MDLLANQDAFPATFPSNADLVAAANSRLPSETKSSNRTTVCSFDPFAASDTIFPSESKDPNTTKSGTIDPFAAIPVSTIPDSDDFFGSFTSTATPASKDPSNESSNNSQPAPKKETFQVKSGIWADSLSRGLIDLNITARELLLCILLFG